MADNWNGAPASFATDEVPGSAKLNEEIRDRATALFNSLTGDASADTDVKHAHKSAAAGTAPPTASKAARIFLPDGQLYGENAAASGHHCYGPGPYDDFLRADSGTISPSKSGHTWTEESGAWSIASNGLFVATSGHATLDTKALLTRNYTVRAQFRLGTGTNEVSVIWKFADSNNYLYIVLKDTNSLAIVKRIAGVETQIGAAVTYTVTNAAAYWMEVHAIGQLVTCRVWTDEGTGQVVSITNRHADFMHANLATATKVGVRIANAIDSCIGFDVRF